MVSHKIDDFRGSWSTPVVVRQGERDLLLTSLPKRLVALDPLSGHDVWYCEGLGELVYSSPLYSNDTAVVAMSGYHGAAIAVRWFGQGEITTTHRLWIHDERPPQRVGSGIIVDGYIYVLNEPGIAWCMELLTGDIVWKQRLGDAPSWSSMCYADGRLYVSDTEGTTFVIAPDSAECLVLARNSFGERTRASLAFSEGQIFAAHTGISIACRRPSDHGRIRRVELRGYSATIGPSTRVRDCRGLTCRRDWARVFRQLPGSSAREAWRESPVRDPYAGFTWFGSDGSTRAVFRIGCGPAAFGEPAQGG